MSTVNAKIEALAQQRQLGLFAGAAREQPLPKAQSVEVARALADSLAEPPLAHRGVIARQLRELQERARQEADELALVNAVHASASPSDRLLLVDGRNVLDSAYHAAAARPGQDVSPRGIPVGGLRGFVQAILRQLGTEKPTHVAIVFDHKDGSVPRRKIYPQYKSDRPEKPLDHLAQIELAKTFCAAMGLPVYCSPTCEADDVIATLVHRSPPAWWVLVASNDKDLLELVKRPKTAVSWWRDGITHYADDEAAVVKRLGVLPNQVTDFLALVGDTTDNIPGIAGIGPKTAADLLKQYRSLAGIYTNWGGIAGRGAKRTKSLLREGRAAAEKSRHLAQLRIDVDDPAIPSAWMIAELLRWGWGCARRDRLFELGREWGIDWLMRDPREEQRHGDDR